MKIEIELPEDEGGIDVFWEDNAKCRLTVDKRYRFMGAKI